MSLPEPGLHQRVPFADYLKWPAVSNTLLSHGMRSWAYCKHVRDNPPTITEAQRFGVACHTAVLEPELFEFKYVVAGQCQAETKSGKRCSNTGSIYCGGHWFCGVRGHAPGSGDPVGMMLDQGEYDRCQYIRDAVYEHPVAHELLRDVALQREVSMVWKDPETGLMCKGRADLLGNGLVADVKVTRDAHPSRFDRFLGKYGGHRQLGNYSSGSEALGLRKDPACKFIAVEPTPPHEVAVYELHPDAIRAGIEHVRRLMLDYAACVQSNDWPGYDTEARTVMPPEWAMQQAVPDEFATVSIGGERMEF